MHVMHQMPHQVKPPKQSAYLITNKSDYRIISKLNWVSTVRFESELIRKAMRLAEGDVCFCDLIAIVS